MWAFGRYLEIIKAVWPELVGATMVSIPKFLAVWPTAWPIASVMSERSKRLMLNASCSCNSFSVRTQIAAIVLTASSGKSPAAVSPESITASVPSKIALATSPASARVGRGLRCIESNIWVAVTTGLPAWLHFLMMYFWTIGTSWVGISTPKSPRATMIPSDTDKISSMLSTPSWFSILEMILTFGRPSCSKISRISITSLARRTKDAAMKSIPSRTPKRMSAASFSVIPGKLMETLGTLTPFLDLITPEFWISVTNSWLAWSISVTNKSTKPSSKRMWLPTSTSLIKLA